MISSINFQMTNDAEARTEKAMDWITLWRRVSIYRPVEVMVQTLNRFREVSVGKKPFCLKPDVINNQ